MRFGASADFLLRLAVALAFLYPAVNAVLDPYAWVVYLPVFMRDIVQDATLLHIFGVVQTAIGLWILSGRHIFIPTVAATGLLAAIVLFNLGDFQVLFRDVSIGLVSLSLAIAHRPRPKSV